MPILTSSEYFFLFLAVNPGIFSALPGMPAGSVFTATALAAIIGTLNKAIGAGIGLFIAFIGMQNSGIIVKNDATLVSLGHITQGTALLAMIGLFITAGLVMAKIRGGILWGILQV